jgi:hypothetical protein
MKKKVSSPRGPYKKREIVEAITTIIPTETIKKQQYNWRKHLKPKNQSNYKRNTPNIIININL